MPSNNKTQMASEVWRLMSDFSHAEFRQKSQALRELGLTPGHIKALSIFTPGDSQSMGACAQEMGCDASTATWLVDRLEERGLVERRPSPTDRRVKEVVLTEQGVVTRARLNEHFHEPPEALLELDEESLAQMHELLSKLRSRVPA